MPTPSESASNLAAKAAQTALETAANDEFIAQATLVIADAVSQGQFIAYMYSIPGMNFQTIFLYFQELGYVIGNPESQTGQLGPAALFGIFWQNYWNNVSPQMPLTPTKLFIAWST
ncbi:hypothetical protein CCP1ISM_130009 [Azospirillaceae bacterium]